MIKIKKYILALFFFLIVIFFFNKNILNIYLSYKLSNWIDRDIDTSEIRVNYPNKLYIKNLSIKNNIDSFYKNFFIAETIVIDADIKSLIFKDPILVNKIQIDNAKFFLEIRKTKQKNLYNLQSREFEDNLGIAQKITTNAPDKVWPKKKKDINFLIKKSNLNNIKTNILINNIIEEKDIILSQMTFSNFGNEKGYQHYKDVFKFIFFDIYGRISNFEIKKKIKNIYGL